MSAKQYDRRRRFFKDIARSDAIGLIGNGSRPWYIRLLSLFSKKHGVNFDTQYKYRLDYVIKAMKKNYSHVYK